MRDPSDLIRTESALPDAGPLCLLSELAVSFVDDQALQRRAGGEPLPHVDIVVHRLWPITGSRSARC
ncbi:hypothetical protein [Streptomyces cyaneofuscatus]